mmetsp:Transcript_9201/g.22560  ORF Transcript_9201/g.22560 Transcript_9201/m.22560 type:complete len:530 (-) Transcript_9201:382-1971(-)|eukprot:CAMPEP_0178989854 /NCGR_PEP_ID=MMETSP0795-20121207/4608_1 /TAXON_ID=88552 /ORGANISM="Amoebophrya sp., Strain Ameob2" /LENGTH=529 /DNA_ID=CAMNT_0020681307 /DNA_START=78 /DNA_END=1667 /DNA_ORIENTATION=+
MDRKAPPCSQHHCTTPAQQPVAEVDVEDPLYASAPTSSACGSFTTVRTVKSKARCKGEIRREREKRRRLLRKAKIGLAPLQLHLEADEGARGLPQHAGDAGTLSPRPSPSAPLHEGRGDNEAATLGAADDQRGRSRKTELQRDEVKMKVKRKKPAHRSARKKQGRNSRTRYSLFPGHPEWLWSTSDAAMLFVPTHEYYAHEHYFDSVNFGYILPPHDARFSPWMNNDYALNASTGTAAAPGITSAMLQVHYQLRRARAALSVWPLSAGDTATEIGTGIHGGADATTNAMTTSSSSPSPSTPEQIDDGNAASCVAPLPTLLSLSAGKRKGTAPSSSSTTISGAASATHRMSYLAAATKAIAYKKNPNTASVAKKEEITSTPVPEPLPASTPPTPVQEGQHPAWSTQRDVPEFVPGGTSSGAEGGWQEDAPPSTSTACSWANMCMGDFIWPTTSFVNISMPTSSVYAPMWVVLPAPEVDPEVEAGIGSAAAPRSSELAECMHSRQLLVGQPQRGQVLDDSMKTSVGTIRVQ